MRMLPDLRPLLVCTALALPAVGVGACGSSHTASERDTDGDIDSLGKSPYDNDNDAPFVFGAPANAADRQAVGALVRRYYAAGAADLPGRACSMLDPLVVEVAVEEHSHGRGPPSLRGDTCERILAKLFKVRHMELVRDIAANRVLAVQVKGDRGVALMRFAGTRERVVPVHRRGATWRMGVLLDGGSP